MANPVATAIGRVQPIFKGTWDSTLSYTKLDNVLYNGSTYIAIQNAPAGANPGTEGSPYWRMIASKGDSIKGDTGSFGTPTATAHDLVYGQEPTVEVIASGPDTAKIFSFNFGLPAGPTAFDTDNIEASAVTLQAGSQPTVTAEINNNILNFEFGIPSASGSGAQSIDGITPALDPVTQLQNVTLNAIRAVQNQNLSPLQQQYARENINAQVAGNYQPAGDYMLNPTRPSNEAFLQYDALNDVWVGKSIIEVPLASQAQAGYFLRVGVNSNVYWDKVEALPIGGSTGAPLVKKTNTNYDVEWGSFISEAEIDAIIEAN